MDELKQASRFFGELANTYHRLGLHNTAWYYRSMAVTLLAARDLILLFSEKSDG